jgi:hypothetical protein
MGIALLLIPCDDIILSEGIYEYALDFERK